MKNKTDLHNSILSLQNDLSNEYMFDLYIFKCKPVSGTKSNDKYIKDTISLYCKNHKNFDSSKLYRDLSTFENISKYDTLVTIDDTIILKEIYSILSFIHQTQINIKTVNSKIYPKQYFASYNFDKREVKRESNRFKKEYKKTRNPISNKKEYKLMGKLLNLYYKDKIVFEYFLHSLVLNDIDKISDIYKIDINKLQIIFDKLSFVTTQKTTKNAIIKSLGIILYFKLKTQLKMSIEDSELYTSLIIENLFKIPFSTSNMKYKIYIKSLINCTPIFGASRKSYYNQYKIKIIKKIFYKQMNSLNSKNDLEKLDTDSLIKNALDKPQHQYILKYPIELLEKNPKYQNK